MPRKKTPTPAARVAVLEQQVRELGDRLTTVEDNATPALDRTIVEDIVLDLLERKRLEVLPKAETKATQATQPEQLFDPVTGLRQPSAEQTADKNNTGDGIPFDVQL